VHDTLVSCSAIEVVSKETFTTSGGKSMLCLESRSSVLNIHLAGNAATSRFTI
jgi:hypothetical protein